MIVPSSVIDIVVVLVVFTLSGRHWNSDTSNLLMDVLTQHSSTLRYLEHSLLICFLTDRHCSSAFWIPALLLYELSK